MQVKMVMARKPIQKPGAYELSTIGLIQGTPFELMFLNEKYIIIKKENNRGSIQLNKENIYVTEKDVFCQTNQFFRFEFHDFAS